VSVLNRKLLRDMRAQVGVLLAVLAIIAVGASSFVSMRSAQRVLETSQHAYYSRYRFADFWVRVKKAPLSVVEQASRIQGIADLDARVVFDVILDVPGVERPLSGRLTSIPPGQLDEVINGIHILRGSGFSDDRDEETIIDDAFAQAHGLEPGDRVELILNRRRESFVIVGTAISPEYVYSVRGEGDVVPDPEHFAVLYVKERYARDVLDFQDACNEIVGLVVPGREADVELLLERLADQFEPYGVLAKVPRSRQSSHRFLSDEIHGLSVSAVIMTTVFLGVAALVINILMSRLADRQRTIIGTLKALGYGRRAVLMHYLGFGVAIGLVGGLLGIGLGVGFKSLMLDMYRKFYRFPEYLDRMYPGLMAVAVGTSVLFAILGTTKGVWKVLKLAPAEAMRPRPPDRGGAVFLERFPALWQKLGFRTHIAVRSLARNPGRTATTVVCSSMATAILLINFVMWDGIWWLLDFQFEAVTRSDVDIGLRDEESLEALYEAQRLPGVNRAEPSLGLTCDLRHGRFVRRVAISGLSEDRLLLIPRTESGAPVPIPPRGLVVSRMLAKILDVDVGDQVEVKPVRGGQRARMVPVAQVTDNFLGLACYADLDYLNTVVGEAATINSLQLAVSEAEQPELFRTLKELPNAQGLSVRADTRENIERTLGESISTSIGLMIFFAGVIGLGAILNASLIEIADRMRDIATFRVLGYTPAQIAGIFFRQNLIIHTLGVMVGLPLGYWGAAAIANEYSSELFRMPMVLRAHTVVLTLVIGVVFVLLAQWVVRRQVRRLDWLEGVKIKE
jgi:putative ABC transport system permease protein